MFKRSLALGFLTLSFACASDEPGIRCDEEYGECLCEMDGSWIPDGWLCDGENDCGDWQDERGCPGVHVPKLDCAGERCRCRNGERIYADYVCDGDNDCGDWEDEDGCTVGPYSSDDASASSAGSSSGSSGGSSSNPCAGLSGPALCVCVTNDIGHCSRIWGR